MVSFTGSTAVGQRIGEVAGRDMKRLLLELGGKGAAIVFDDADLKTAVGAIASVWAFHSGQICTAPTRVIVQRGIYDQLVAGLAGRGRAAEGRATRWRATPSSARSSPAPTATGSRATSGPAATRAPPSPPAASAPSSSTGFYVAPTLLADAKPDMTVVQEEIFGPVVVVVPFDDEDEAVALANDTDFGLYDYVFSRRHGAGPWPSPSGCGPATSASTPLSATTRPPFGGFKHSGVGRDGGQLRPPRLQRDAVDRLAGLSRDPAGPRDR